MGVQKSADDQPISLVSFIAGFSNATSTNPSIAITVQIQMAPAYAPVTSKTYPAITGPKAPPMLPHQCAVLFERRVENYLDMECLAMVDMLLFEYLKDECSH
jgi:hypothetical protein